MKIHISIFGSAIFGLAIWAAIGAAAAAESQSRPSDTASTPTVNVRKTEGSQPAMTSQDDPTSPVAKVDLKVGDAAPRFKALDQDGKPFDSKKKLGKTLVVYFYPAAMTGGCTAQACAYRDNSARLAELGAEVVGVSGDTPEGLKLFRQAEGLNFTLLSDPKGEVARSFGVPTRDGGELRRVVDGVSHLLSRGVSASRWTFVIGPDGTILHKNAKVTAADDSSQVIELLEKLAKKE